MLHVGQNQLLLGLLFGNCSLEQYKNRLLPKTETMNKISVAKATLRKKILTKISNLSNDIKDHQSEEVAKMLFSSPEFINAKRISVFLSTENEINTKPIVEKIFETKKQCFVPRYSKQKMEMVNLNSMKDWENLPLTAWNIKQPSLKEERVNALETGGIDLLIVPGVAFTADGKRLGHGGGYYDKYIKIIREKQAILPKTVGLAFYQQIVNDLYNVALGPVKVF